MSSRDPHQPDDGRRPSYLAIVAIILASTAIGLSLWRTPEPSTPATPVAALSVVQAPAAERSASAAGARSYSPAVEKAAPSVVNVYTAKRVPRSARRYENPLSRYSYGDTEPEQPSTALGSGVILSAQGYILTNNHVIEGADEFAVAIVHQANRRESSSTRMTSGRMVMFIDAAAASVRPSAGGPDLRTF